MKITKLHIEKYKHLENLVFDFTYQSGDKKGQPLEKICFIGQSATGKTNILNLITDEINSIYNIIFNHNVFDYGNNVKDNNYIGNITFQNNSQELYFDKSKIKFGNIHLKKVKPNTNGSYDRFLKDNQKEEKQIYIKYMYINKTEKKKPEL